jgi:hypothetical protein
MRIICTISMPPRITRAVAADWSPSIGQSRRLILLNPVIQVAALPDPDRLYLAP